MSYCTKKIAVVFIIRENGKYLFQKRMHTGWHDGYYVLPGGHVEEGETLIEAAIRETEEEIKRRVKLLSKEEICCEEYSSFEFDGEFIESFYNCTPLNLGVENSFKILSYPPKIVMDMYFSNHFFVE